jgi:hypothetical protein
MALIAVAADKGAPGVTTASVALAAVWPRPVLLAECDPAGGDLVYRLPGADGTRLDPRRGLLTLAVAARRGLRPDQVWEHAQKLHGGLDVLAGVASAEQGAGLEALWEVVGGLLARVPQADVIADCGRIGGDGPFYGLLAEADEVVLVTRASLADVVRLRDRISALTSALHKRGRPGTRVGVMVIADHRTFKTALAEVGHAIGAGRGPATIIGGLAYEPKSAEQLRGQWGGKLDKTLLIRTAREIASYLLAQLPDLGAPPAQQAAARAAPPHAGPAAAGPYPGPATAGPHPAAPGGPGATGPQPAQPGIRGPGTHGPGPRPGPAPADPLLAAPPGEAYPGRPDDRPVPREPPASLPEARPMPRGRHASPPPASAGWAERDLPDHHERPGSPSAPVPGGPAALPGDPGGW